MLMPSQGMRILVATKPTSGRGTTDWWRWRSRCWRRTLSPARSLAMVLEPMAQHGAMLRSKRVGRLKILFWDGSGLVMACKRLKIDSFAWPAVRGHDLA